MLKLLIKKRKGQGDLIASFFVILALTLFVFFFINTIGDVNTRIELDQIARKYILRMESSGTLTDDEKNNLIAECSNVKAVKTALALDTSKQIEVSFNENGQPKGYGSNITLTIKCPAVVTGYHLEDGEMIGSISRKTPITYTITKQSTAKY